MHATLCQTLADPTRITLLYELNEGPRHVNQLVEALNLPQTTVSRHLKILRDRSLVTTRRDGSFIYYALSQPRVIEALDIMRLVMKDILAEQSNLAEVVSNIS